jgi:trimeric autotransporter adhesin
MVSTRRKLQVLGSSCVLLLIAFAIGCNGFFVDPNLTGISVQTLNSTTLSTVGSTAQLQATGTYDDGSTKNLTGKATWSVSPTGFITLSATSPGLATATQVTTPGTSVTVQAADQASNGTVVSGTITLTAGTSTSLTITSSAGTTISITGQGSNPIQFAAQLNGSDVTSSTTFVSSNTSIINITSGSSTGTLGGTAGTVTITGTDSSASATGTLTVIVTQ